MKLHEAIVKLLKHAGRAMTTSEIAKALNENKWYQKKDGSAITAYQVHGRTRNYSHLFDRKGSWVSLKGTESSGKISRDALQKIPMVQPKILWTYEDLEKKLITDGEFKSAGMIDNLVPAVAGLYCIRIADVNILPKIFAEHLILREHNIIYIGTASKNLNKRLLCQELRAMGHGTFFRSIGALIGYRPEKGSLNKKRNKRNYKFSKSDEKNIIDWINANLLVNWIPYEANIGDHETYLIQKHYPLLNIAKNPKALNELRDLRSECVSIACCVE